MKRILLVVFVASLAAGACSKEESESLQSTSQQVESFRDIQVPEGFDFSPHQNHTLNIPPQTTKGSPYRLIELVNSRGTVILKYRVNLNEGAELPFMAALTSEHISVRCNGHSKELKLDAKNLTLNLY